MKKNRNNLYSFDLTQSQKHVWYVEKLYPGQSIYNLGGTVRFIGDLELTILEKSIQMYIQSNDNIRFQIFEKNGIPQLYVEDYKEKLLEVVDFSKEKDSELLFGQLVCQWSSTPFPLIDSPLFEFKLFRLNHSIAGFYVNLHHLIADGWSVDLMTTAICNTYNQIAKGNGCCNEVEDYSYQDFLKSEKEYLASPHYHVDFEYWSQILGDAPEPLFLQAPNDRLEGDRYSLQIPQERITGIKNYIGRLGVSMNDFFTSVIAVLLYKYYGRQDFVLGIPVMNRTGKKQKKLFGMCTQTLPLRISINDRMSLESFVLSCRTLFMKNLRHRKFPYDEILNLLQSNHHEIPLFQFGFNYYNTTLSGHVDGLEINNLEFHSGHQIVPMQFIVKEWNNLNSITIEIDYLTDQFPVWMVENFGRYIQKIVHAFVSEPNLMLVDLNILDQYEFEQVALAYNNTFKNVPEKTIHCLFEEQVLRTPHNIAISDNGQDWSYRELNERAEKVAGYLLQNGWAPRSIIGIAIERSAECLVAILGVLKSGAAYLPIEIGTPTERIGYMLQDAKVEVCLIVDPTALPENLMVKRINLTDNCIKNVDIYPKGDLSNTESLTYVIYTSGSTGQPKGVAIQQKSLVNYIMFAKHTYTSENCCDFALYSSLAFDLTVTTIFTPLICGGRINIYRGEADNALLEAWRDGAFDVIKLTPSHLVILEGLGISEKLFLSLKVIIVGGEDFKVSHALKISERFDNRVSIFNEYGPTEATVGCMIHKFEKERDLGASVPIGKPIYNTQLYILDSEQKLLPYGAEGEIYVSGEGLAWGYINNSALTHEKFFSHPYANGKRVYKTGDRGRLLPSMIMEYRGRIDEQVKLNGYRIELREIDAVLNKLPEIQTAVSVVLELAGSGMVLCAYYVKRESIDENQIKLRLLEFLPNYMIPFFFVEMDSIPVNQNGKLDKRLLPLPINKSAFPEKMPVLNETSKVILEELKQLIGAESLGPKDNFYYIGGDSVKAIQLSARLYEKGIILKSKDILSYPDIEQMLLRSVNENTQVHEGETICGFVKTTPIVSWFFEQGFKNENYYFHTVSLDLTKLFTQKALSDVFQALINHHDETRLNFDRTQKQLFYNEEHLAGYCDVKEYDLCHLSDADQVDVIENTVNEAMAQIDITKSLLLQAVAFQLNPHKTRLCIFAHHLIIDGISWRILLEDLGTLLESSEEGRTAAIPRRTDSYKRWSEILMSEQLSNEEFQYWLNVIDDMNSSINFESAFSTGTRASCPVETIKREILEEETGYLASLSARHFKVDLATLLLSVFLETMGIYSEDEDYVWILMEGHGRQELSNEVNVTRSVGWFTNQYPVRLRTDLRGEKAIIDVVKRLEDIPRGGIGYGLCGLTAEKSPNIMFNFLGDFQFNHKYFYLADGGYGKKVGQDNYPSIGLEVNIFLLKEKLHISFDVSQSFVKDAVLLIDLYIGSIKKFARSYQDHSHIEFIDAVGLNDEDLNMLFS